MKLFKIYIIYNTILFTLYHWFTFMNLLSIIIIFFCKNIFKNLFIFVLIKYVYNLSNQIKKRKIYSYFSYINKVMIKFMKKYEWYYYIIIWYDDIILIFLLFSVAICVVRINFKHAKGNDFLRNSGSWFILLYCRW